MRLTRSKKHLITKADNFKNRKLGAKTRHIYKTCKRRKYLTSVNSASVRIRDSLADFNFHSIVNTFGRWGRACLPSRQVGGGKEGEREGETKR